MAPDVTPVIVTSVPKVPEAFDTSKIFVEVFMPTTEAVIVVEPSEPNAETVSSVEKEPTRSTTKR